MKESDFQSGLIKEIEKRYPGAVVLKNDPRYKKGIPDLTILHKNHWAVLECKKDKLAAHQPGQDNYISRLNGMSCAYFIYPENKEDILNEMDKTFKT